MRYGQCNLPLTSDCVELLITDVAFASAPQSVDNIQSCFLKQGGKERDAGTVPASLRLKCVDERGRRL